jgi:hypothetical protein
MAKQSSYTDNVVRIHRNWSNQNDPKSDLVRVARLTPVQMRSVIDFMIANAEHFHYFADHGGKQNHIQCSGKAFTKWEAEQTIETVASS